ncbi:MAG: hypothetical protein MHPSP_000362 [Paramarteilia canceri]
MVDSTEPETELKNDSLSSQDFIFHYEYRKDRNEYIIFQIKDNWLIYNNSSSYRNEMQICRKVLLSNAVMKVLQKITEDANLDEVVISDDDKWGKNGVETMWVMSDKNSTKKEFKIRKLASILEAQFCESDVEHVKTVYYYIKDMLQFLISVILMHFNEDPYQMI